MAITLYVSSTGWITDCHGTLQSTKVSTSFVFPPDTSGSQTLSCTTSKIHEVPQNSQSASQSVSYPILFKDRHLTNKCFTTSSPSVKSTHLISKEFMRQSFLFSHTYILILTTTVKIKTLCLFWSPVLASPTDSLKPLRVSLFLLGCHLWIWC